MATQQNAAAVPRRDARAGGALDAATRRQVAELNRRVIDALGELLARDPRVVRAAPAAAAGRRGRRAAAVAPPVPAEGRATPAARSSSSSLAHGWHVPAADPALTPTLLGLGAAWLALDAAARAALATCPYLLVELDVARLLASPAPPAGVREVPGAASTPPAWRAPWADVGRMVFQYAWHCAQVSPVLAGFVLGMRARDVDALRGLGLSQVDALAPRAESRVALRWRDDSALWSAWLAAARGGDAAALRACELRGLQRLAGAGRMALPP